MRKTLRVGAVIALLMAVFTGRAMAQSGAVNAKRYYDWLMSPEGQSIGGKADSLQSPANKTFKPDPRIPAMDSVRLVKYDFEKYGKSAERRRLLERWNKEVGAQVR